MENITLTDLLQLHNCQTVTQGTPGSSECLIISSVQNNSFFIMKTNSFFNMKANLASVIFVFAWVAGVVLSPFWDLKLGAALFPPYSYYVLLERVISTYTPDLLNK
jgi:hypothetical protein